MANRRLRLVESDGLDRQARERSQDASRAAFLSEAQSAFNYVVYSCARWIARVGRSRLDFAARS